MRILIATVTAGGGHLQAAAALEEAWKAQRPSDELKRVDLLDYVPRLQRKLYSEGYVKVVERAPELYALVFKKTDDPRRMRKWNNFRRRLARHTNRKFVRFLRAFRPDAVLCTHFLPLEILGALKAKGRDAHPLTVCAVTDFEAHTLWIETCVDLYCVATEETKASLAARGVPAGTITVTGIPIAAKFSAAVDSAAFRRRAGLRDDLPTLLVLGGGFGMGPVAGILSALDKVEREFQTVVVAGRNEELRRRLAARDHRHPTHVLGFVTNMQEWMAVADLILTKPGGLTTSEALAAGKPIFVLNPIPGQEAANSDFLLERGAAVKVNRLEDLAFRVEGLLGSARLAALAGAAQALGRPHAARDVCAAVAKRLAHS